VPDERTGAVGDAEPGGAPRFTRAFGSAVRGDHDLGGVRAGEIVEGSALDALLAELFLNDGVVDEFTEDGERGMLGEAFGLGDGVADAEAEAEMVGEFDDHKGRKR
jgi:hypothetical protein